MMRFMRLICFFDLPVMTKDERRVAATFRKFLVKDGFFMVQFSVYCRICNGYEMVEQHENYIRANLPHKGCVRTIAITEKQYQGMKIWVGKIKPNDKKYSEGQISFL